VFAQFLWLGYLKMLVLTVDLAKKFSFQMVTEIGWWLVLDIKYQIIQLTTVRNALQQQ